MVTPCKVDSTVMSVTPRRALMVLRQGAAPLK